MASTKGPFDMPTNNMGSNDHVPVPDPKPRVHVSSPLSDQDRFLKKPISLKPTPPPVDCVKFAEHIGGPTTSSERLDNVEADVALCLLDGDKRLDSLERSRERHDAQAVDLRNSLTGMDYSIVELRRLLRQTIRGVERLAQGHSKGNLGLPTDEDWEGF